MHNLCAHRVLLLRNNSSLYQRPMEKRNVNRPESAKPSTPFRRRPRNLLKETGSGLDIDQQFCKSSCEAKKIGNPHRCARARTSAIQPGAVDAIVGNKWGGRGCAALFWHERSAWSPSRCTRATRPGECLSRPLRPGCGAWLKSRRGKRFPRRRLSVSREAVAHVRGAATNRREKELLGWGVARAFSSPPTSTPVAVTGTTSRRIIDFHTGAATLNNAARRATPPACSRGSRSRAGPTR